jgi:hypothetical protein
MTAAGDPLDRARLSGLATSVRSGEAAGVAPTAARTPPAVTVGFPFAHASEAEMARILDFYGVDWNYEPHTFPILWNLDGDVVESFSPDFYLPELDLYLEITTLRQRLVRKKNRKLRRLRELYPGLQVKLFYARDFRALLLKYGKLALAPSLSGSEGQVAAAPPRPPAADRRAVREGRAGLRPGPSGSLSKGEERAEADTAATGAGLGER